MTTENKLPAQVTIDTQVLLDMMWASVDEMKRREKIECGSGSYDLGRALVISEVLKLGGMKFDSTSELPRNIN